MSVVETVAEAMDTDPRDLPPLYEVVDPDALDTLFKPVGGRLGLKISFEYIGHEITITDDGEVVITAERLPER